MHDGNDDDYYDDDDHDEHIHGFADGDIGVPYQKHSEASREAAEKFAPHKLTKRREVYDFIHDHPRVCDRHIQIGLDMNPNTERPRRIELERNGLIRPDGLVKTPKGSDGVAYVVTDKPYPEKWSDVEKRSDLQRRRSERPTPEEFQEAVVFMRRAYKTMAAQGARPSRQAVKVLRWLSRRT